MNNATTRRVLSVIVAAAATMSLTACGGSSSAKDDNVIEFWDPYPQKTADSTWQAFVEKCAPDGYTVKRAGYAQSDLLNNLTTAVKADNAPEIALIDNPKMPTAVDAGLITDIKAAGVDVSGYDENIEGPGIIDGVQYGVSYGSNALGLYYNPTVLEKAGVDPASITDWDSLNDAIEKVVNAGYKGITFAGISGEEGTFQFLPWFWGAGGNLAKVSGSSAEKDALDLVSNWVKQGWAPKSVATDNQSAAWDLFLTGEYGFSENGSWQAESAAEERYEMIPIPSKDGGVAPVPTGGEFITIPTQKNMSDDKLKATVDVIECLIDGDNLKALNDEMVYLAAKSDVRAKQVEENEIWKPWVEIVESASGRTTDVGLEYEDISAQLSEDLQTSLNES
ncbi:ABC transporter substrate-binding protein [Bifidobacterium longum]|jgi:multiple sugar transport system substrate-binding protein|uniref:Extracellular solute-binding protein n=3 Tax=Bifidobacterium longum TaxID=216816 RepID=A0A9Q8QVX9_BIFLL|nr:extracellular solute-binding protein [Bifidobacterium longum]ADH00769.1 extracellular solute-binding protein, family 1 [Bifidobacterium longum subsp. longum JDM301]AIF90834.1 ABC transporter substrate-binding protein [Bifidobacterium longum]UIP49017.1 extracellular solute-binding protein [Bifidobacterium longum]UNL65206.1 extracellular solute-binding protein [Bifidobacterium longum subsp. longum]UNL67189.1 extracellular solute-binding protein [Bifidobacterium longum subsp. longum]